MGKTKQEKGGNIQTFTQWIVVSVILFVYFLLVLLSYSSQMKKTSAEVELTHMGYHVERIASGFAQQVEEVSQAARTVAAAISVEDTILGEKSYDIVQRAVDSSPAIYGYISDDTGMAVDIKGNSLNVWANEDFARALTGIQVISDIKDQEAGQNVIAVYAPVAEKGTVTGVVCLQYPAEQFTMIPVTADYDGYTVYALMKSDGTVVTLIGGNNKVVEPGANLFELIRDVKESAANSEIRKFRQNIENKKSSQVVAMIDSNRWFFNCANTGINDWYALEIHSGLYYDRATTKYYVPTKKVLLRLFIALFLFFGAVIILNILNKTLYNRSAQELQNRAETDLLTGLYNKIATEKHIQEHLDGDGKDEPAMLCVLDIDNFKKINDTMGHAFGDQVLATLGVKIKNQFRASDIIGRIGGDEFIVFLKKIPNDEIMNKECDKLMSFFKDFKAGDYVKYSATASVGVAMYPEDGQSFDQLYKAADKGVYHSKQQGKNQLTLYRDIK